MLVIRTVYVLLVLGSGALLLPFDPGPHGWVLLGVGALVILATFVLELRLRRSSLAARETVSGGLGLLLGLLVGRVTLSALDELPLIAVFSEQGSSFASAVFLLFLCMLGYLGLVAGLVVARETLRRPPPEEAGIPQTRYLLGEKGLVDGRALRLAQSALLAGEIVVPRYVVDTLQTLAGSKNPIEHVRGERGLETLRALQQVPGRRVRIQEIDVLRGEVGGILDFAQEYDTRIITQDAELLAEAARRGVPTVDLNALGDLLKPEVVQGDELVVKLVKPGKEREQAVGYLEGGNMVVVENAREEVGRTVRVVVTGIHQTRAGTLIFGNRKDAPRDAPREASREAPREALAEAEVLGDDSETVAGEPPPTPPGLQA